MVAVTKAEETAEAALVAEIKAAEAARQAEEFKAKQMIIHAEAEQASASQKAEAIKILADAEAAADRTNEARACDLPDSDAKGAEQGVEGEER